MATTSQYGALFADTLRITRLESGSCCNAPAVGSAEATNAVMVIKDNLVRVTLSPNYNDGEEISRTNGRGVTCLSTTTNSNLADIGAEFEFCSIDPVLSNFLGGQDLVLDAAGEAIGTLFDNSEIDQKIMIEAWSEITSTDLCAGGTQLYAYTALYCVGNLRPNVDIEYSADDFVEVGYSGTGISSGRATPDIFSVVPTAIPAGTIGVTIVTDVAPPTDAGCFDLTV